MSLRTRLNTLRRQSGAGGAPAAPVPDLVDDDDALPLRQRLARAGVGRDNVTRADAEQLARCLGGEISADGLIVIERIVAYSEAHGDGPLSGDFAAAFEFFGYPDDRRALLFLDTETTGLAGGTGTVVFLLGLARCEAAGVRIRQYFLTHFKGEAAMLTQARRFIADSDVMVSYNGKSFDYPLLQTRYRLARMDDPFAGLRHWDLLHTTRRAFARHWPDCRLSSVEQRLLKFHRVDDLPGAEVPQTWQCWLRHGVIDDLPRVVQHNHWDLLSLTALPRRLHRCYAYPDQHQSDVLAAVRHYLERDDETRAYAHLLAHRDRLDEQARLELARLARRRGNWPLAVELWRELAAGRNIEALSRLAKYYEHVSGEPERALRCTRALRRLQPRCAEHDRREQRLLSKIETN